MQRLPRSDSGIDGLIRAVAEVPVPPMPALTLPTQAPAESPLWDYWPDGIAAVLAALMGLSPILVGPAEFARLSANAMSEFLATLPMDLSVGMGLLCAGIGFSSC